MRLICGAQSYYLFKEAFLNFFNADKDCYYVLHLSHLRYYSVHVNIQNPKCSHTGLCADTCRLLLPETAETGGFLGTLMAGFPPLPWCHHGPLNTNRSNQGMRYHSKKTNKAQTTPVRPVGRTPLGVPSWFLKKNLIQCSPLEILSMERP